MDTRFYVIGGNYPANSRERDEIVPKVTEMRTSPVTEEKPLTTVSKYRFRGQNDNGFPRKPAQRCVIAG